MIPRNIYSAEASFIFSSFGFTQNQFRKQSLAV